MIGAYTGHIPVPAPPPRTGFTTPEPQYVPDTPMRIADKLDAASFDEKQRIRTAAHCARIAYPGPIGELIARELMEWAETGWRLAPAGLVMQAVEQLLR